MTAANREAVLDYAAAAVPEPYQILGLKLRSFCIGHYILLRRFDCAFVQDAKGEASHTDLILGVLICSMRPKEFLEFLESPDFESTVAKWGHDVGMWDLKEKALLFQKYLKEGWKEPPNINKQPGSGAPGDWAQNVKITLTARLGYTADYVEEMPMSQALADYYRLAESDGVIKILNDSDMEAMEKNSRAMEFLGKLLGGNNGS